MVWQGLCAVHPCMDGYLGGRDSAVAPLGSTFNVRTVYMVHTVIELLPASGQVTGREGPVLRSGLTSSARPGGLALRVACVCCGSAGGAAAWAGGRRHSIAACVADAVADQLRRLGLYRTHQHHGGCTAYTATATAWGPATQPPLPTLLRMPARCAHCHHWRELLFWGFRSPRPRFLASSSPTSS